MKKFILNADDLGKSKAHNDAVLKGFESGLLKSASILVNGDFFLDAINRVVLPNKNLGIGVHLNIIEGRALNQNSKFLINKKGYFNNNYLSLILKSNSKAFLSEVEQEFEVQIEKAFSLFTPTHIDSHVHTHAIPEIFRISAKLADKYKIKQIRTQREKLYFIKKNYNPINLIKVMLLNYYTYLNQKTLKKYNLNSNDYILGVNYTGSMDKNTILKGLEKINKDSTVEALIHPCCYKNCTKNGHSTEFELTLDKNLQEGIEKMGYFITNYKL